MPSAPPQNLPLQNDPAGDNFVAMNMDANNNPAPLEGPAPLAGEPDRLVPQRSMPGGEQASRVMPPEYRGNGGTRVPLLKSPLPPGAPPSLPGAKKPFLSKKIIIILIILIIAGGGVFVYFNWFRVSEPIIAPILPSPDIIAPAAPEGSGSVPESGNPVVIPADQDQDGDGLTDKEEEALGTNLANSDSDLDGLPDGWEKNNGLNPLDPGDSKHDPDGDGLDNANEYYYHADPFKMDTDGDSYNDGSEVENGYDPAKSGAKLETGNPEQEQQGASTSPGQRDKIRKNDLEALTIALELYYEDHGLFPDNLSSLFPDYVIKLPQDPQVPRYNYQYQKTALSSYTLEAHIESNDDPEDLADGILDHSYKIKVQGE